MYQDNYFAVSEKINLCWRQTKCIDDQYKFQCVKDTDNEFTECQTPRKKLQSIGVQKQKLQLSKAFVTCKNFILLSKKNTQM